MDKEIEDLLKSIDETKIDKLFSKMADISLAMEKGNNNRLVSDLLKLAIITAEISPDVAPLIGMFVDKYGIAMKPILDELVDACIKVSGYSLEKIAEAQKKLAPKIAECNKNQASMYAKNLKLLEEEGFNREEAIEILLLKISKSPDVTNIIEEIFSSNESKK